MTLIIIIYILVFAIFALCGYAVMQIKLAGMNVKDFWSFIEANQILDKLYEFSQKYKTLNKQQQVVYLMEAEKVFTAFDKIPDIIWEDEFKKYDEVLKKYKEIKMEDGYQIKITIFLFYNLNINSLPLTIFSCKISSESLSSTNS